MENAEKFKKLAFAILVSWLFGTLTLVFWRVFQPTTLLFDQFVLISLLILVITFFIFSNHKGDSTYGIFEKFLAASVASLLYFSTVEYGVLAVDRSRSLYIFAWVAEERIIIRDSQVLVINPNKEMMDKEAIQQRVDEQVSRKLMKKRDNLVELTILGKLVFSLSNAMYRIFNLQGWEKNLPN